MLPVPRDAVATNCRDSPIGREAPAGVTVTDSTLAGGSPRAAAAPFAPLQLDRNASAAMREEIITRYEGRPLTCVPFSLRMRKPISEEKEKQIGNLTTARNPRVVWNFIHSLKGRI